MLKLYYKLFSIIMLFIMMSWSFAQCDISNFTLSGTNGVCNQDMSVTVNTLTSPSCSGTVIASIRKSGTAVDLKVASIINGTATFEDLEAGIYEVYLKAGAITTTPKTITLTTTYIPINVIATANNTSCSTTDPQYSSNGTVTVQYSGGSGSYNITLTGPGGPYTHTATSAGSHTFTNLAPGTYLASVQSNSSTCNIGENRSVTILETNWLPMTYSTGRRQLYNNCELYLRIELLDGNKQVTQLPGNATYTIEGDPTVYNLTLASMPATGRYAYRTHYGLPPNKNVTFNITDGCRTLTKIMNTGDISESWQAQSLSTTNDQNCQTVFRFTYKLWDHDDTNNVYYWNFSNQAKLAFYAESPAMSDNWILIQDNVENSNYYGVAGWTEFQTTYTNTRIKVVMSDGSGCNAYEKIVDGRTANNINNLNNIVLAEIAGVLEGTSTISVDKRNASNWSNTDSFSYPVTFNITRKDGQNNIVINPTQPYNLAGSYNITFPFIKTFTTPPTDYWNKDRPIFGDLPLGEYVVTITDGCGYTVTREINLTKPAGYNPSITFNTGCAASDVNYNMNVNSNTHNIGRVYIYKNNNGTLGNLVTGYNANQLLQGTFPSIQPGEYFIVFKNINYYPRLLTTLPYDSNSSNISIARGVSGLDQEYHVAFTVAPYQQMDFSTVSLFCNPTDSNSGILAITAQGIPVGHITYNIWPSSANPATDTPLQTYTTTNLTEMSHVFTGLSVGNYIVRVTNDCGFKEQQITMNMGTPTYPQPVSIPGIVCQGSNATLAIALPDSLFDITWLDSNNVLVGSGSQISFPVNQNGTYTVNYQLKSTFNCTNPFIGSDTIDVIVQGPIQVVSQTTVCNDNDNTYTLTVEMSGATAYNITGIGSPGTWNGTIWTSSPIPAGDAYNITISDTNGCNSITVSGASPNCYCYKPAITTGASLSSNHGITALSRAGATDDNWPMVRKGAWTVLESKSKGFVINRISTSANVENLPNPVEGMMVYDEEAACIKIYTTTDNGATYGWKCFNIQTCPN